MGKSSKAEVKKKKSRCPTTEAWGSKVCQPQRGMKLRCSWEMNAMGDDQIKQNDPISERQIASAVSHLKYLSFIGSHKIVLA